MARGQARGSAHRHTGDLLGRLPADLTLDDLARQTKAIERKRRLESGSGLLRLALARGPGGLSLSATAAWATLLGFAPMRDPGVKYRLDKGVGFLRAVCERQLATKSPGADVRWPGRTLRACDSTGISKRASTGADWPMHARLKRRQQIYYPRRCSFNA